MYNSLNILKTTVLGEKNPINCFGKALNKGDLLREISIQWKYNAKKTWEKKHKKSIRTLPLEYFKSILTSCFILKKLKLEIINIVLQMWVIQKIKVKS